MAVMREMMEKLKLTVNEKKTRRCCTAGRDVHFLGLHVRAVLLDADGAGIYQCLDRRERRSVRLCRKISE